VNGRERTEEVARCVCDGVHVDSLDPRGLYSARAGPSVPSADERELAIDRPIAAALLCVKAAWSLSAADEISSPAFDGPATTKLSK